VEDRFTKCNTTVQAIHSYYNLVWAELFCLVGWVRPAGLKRSCWPLL